jgi:hydrogenase maturation factor
MMVHSVCFAVTSLNAEEQEESIKFLRDLSKKKKKKKRENKKSGIVSRDNF